MKRLPVIKNSCADIYELVRGDFQNGIAVLALKWKLFDHLLEPVSSRAVAEKLGFHPGNTELFLNTLAGMGIIQKREGLYVNTDRTREILVSHTPGYIGAFLLHVHQWHEKMGSNMEDLIQNGPQDNVDMDMTDDSLWAESARSSAAYCYCGPARYIAQTVRGLPGFSNMNKMLDLGGGAGIYTIGIVAEHPDMEGVVFEQPAVAPVTREFIQKYDAEDRISVMEGNYITDAFGDSYDLIFASATLNFIKGCFEDFFGKVYAALKPGGYFITHQDGITDERTKPVYHVAEFLSAELYGADYAIPQGMIAEAMIQCGFSSVRSRTVPSDFGDMDIDIGRK